MSNSAVEYIRNLDEGKILTPERYDSRRRQNNVHGKKLSDFVNIISEQINPLKINNNEQYILLDTGDAKEGVVWHIKSPITTNEIGSSKKLIHAGDVIISRLRPYLRQIAYIDSNLFIKNNKQVQVVCSTEFYVLRSIDKQSIGFLVPFLLSPSIQDVLEAAQEGGHHPRFNQKTLENLHVPLSIVKDRDKISEEISKFSAQVCQALQRIQLLSYSSAS